MAETIWKETEAYAARKIHARGLRFNRPLYYTFEPWNPQYTDPALYIKNELPKFECCQNTGCQGAKDRLQHVAPPFETTDCPNLRDWALNVMSCFIAHPGALPENPALWSAVASCGSFVDQLVQLRRRTHRTLGPNIMGICRMFKWVYSLSIGDSEWASRRVLEHALGQHTVTSFSMSENALEIPKGVCLYRFWNLALSTPCGVEELAPLKAMLCQFRLSDRHLERHRHCTVQVCVQNDENTTAVPQRHLCRDPHGCPLISFPPADVNKIASPENGATAWSISSGQPTLGSKRYMAISHVWSDGTGIGSNTPGDVNKCLVDHFKAVAMTQEILCDGIWWDTVSLPMEKGKRVKALNKMHNNYKKAACTLVHDLELAEFTWADDGSPCVALAFSTWFSRGWTALELYMSETVWVIFKGPDGKPILKDLDKDILAHSNDPFAHPTHKQVSDVIRRLRPHSRRDMDTVSLLLEALRFRYTCWTRDRSIIAGLMIDEMLDAINWFDSTWSQTDITKNILTKCGKLKVDALFHDQVPICDSGPWSWCPPLIFHLKGSNPIMGDILSADVEDGVLHGRWIVLKLKKGDGKNFTPLASHEFLVARATRALNDPDDYYLLNPLGRHPTMEKCPFLLVKLTDRNKLEFRYIGCVTGALSDFQDRRREFPGAPKLILT